MITVIISDLHLTDKFDQKKFDYLEKIISPADRVIINGDFWDKYLTSFDSFCKSSWNKLFPLLKSKKAIYLYGNHDKEEWADSRVNLFSDRRLANLKIQVGKYILFIEHGNRIAPTFDELYPWLPKTRFLVNSFIFWREQIPLLIYDKLLFSYYHRQNEKMKRWWQKKSRKNQILVCGHSHCLEFDLDSRLINTGFIRFGYGQYLRIDGKHLSLIDERY